jgi:acyl-CoA thioesterase-2
MDTRLTELLHLLDLERLELNLFRGTSRDIGSPQVFGGQVLGQALVAASRTVEDRLVHSLHAYFLRRGDFNAPIVYQVERSRDGGSFTSRRVVAIQHGQPILTMSSSFHAAEPGSEHQAGMPVVPPPEDLQDADVLTAEILERVPEKVRRFFEHERPFEFRHVRPPDYRKPEKREPVKQVWFRLVDAAPDDPALHRCLLAYVSDYHLLDTADLPHGQPWFELQMASIDHAIWFHRDLRVDDWLLYSIDSPSRSSARGFARGSIFTRDGMLVASVVQEGLIRERPGGWQGTRPPGAGSQP